MTSCVPHAIIIRLKRRSGSFWTDCDARTALLNFTALRGYLRASYRSGPWISWSLASYTARDASADEVNDLRRETRSLKEVVTAQTLELRLLKKHAGIQGRPNSRKASI